VHPADRLKEFKSRAKTMGAAQRSAALTSEDFKRLVEEVACSDPSAADCEVHCVGHCETHCYGHTPPWAAELRGR
jgi:hypothetical protein